MESRLFCLEAIARFYTHWSFTVLYISVKTNCNNTVKSNQLKSTSKDVKGGGRKRLPTVCICVTGYQPK